MNSIDQARMFWVARCPKCLSIRAAVEVGEGDSYSKALLEQDYAVSQAPGPILSRPHAKECPHAKEGK